jgi:hypothetical protein
MVKIGEEKERRTNVSRGTVDDLLALDGAVV